jgi:hypothetical protein
MSNIVTITCQYTDKNIIKAAVKRCQAVLLGKDGEEVTEPAVGTHRFYSGNRTGIGVKLRGWEYPAVITDKTVEFDNHNGRWGQLDRLREFQQAYAVESVLAKARNSRQFCQVQENQLENGCVEILCTAY